MRSKKASRALTVAALTLTAGTASATWSIVIVDTRTGEIAAGSATCLTNINLKDETPVIILGRGAATAQALLETTGVTRSDLRQGLLNGDHPDEILRTLASLDSGHRTRQYGLVDAQGRAMTFSGGGNSDWAGGVTGRIERGAPGPEDDIVYAIQGNILTGEGVVLAAEAAVRASSGDIADMLMEGMQAARITGGDGRCSCPTGGPTDCGTPPGEPDEFKSADVGYMIVGRTGDVDSSRALYRYTDYSSSIGFDLNDNGHDELLTFSINSGLVRVSSYLENSVPGALAVEPEQEFQLPLVGVRSVVAGDVTGDGIDDLVVLIANRRAVSAIPGLPGGGLDLNAITITALDEEVYDMTLVDLDNAGGLDLVVVQSNAGHVLPLISDASGGFTQGVAVPILGVRGPIRTGDLDHDGDLDLAVATTGSGVQLLSNEGGGGLGLAGSFSTSDRVRDLAIMDLDNDNEGELLVLEDGSHDVEVYSSDGTHTQSLRAGFSPRSFHFGKFADAEGESLLVESNFLHTIINPDGAGQIQKHSFERLRSALVRTASLDLNADGFHEIAGMVENPVQDPLLVLVENLGGQMHEPRGWGAGRYWLTLNVANTQRSDPDPVVTLQEKFDRWRDARAGQTDASLSVLSGELAPIAPGQTTVYTANLQAYPGVPITTTPVVTAQTSDPSVARVVAIEMQGTDTARITLEGVSPGSVSLRVEADEGGARPIVLMPLPTVEVASNPADFDGDGVVTQNDLKQFVNAFVSGDPRADTDGDGVVGPGDVAAFVESFLEATGRGRGRFKH